MLSLAIATSTVTFRNSASALVDPDVITMRYKSRDSAWITKRYPADITRSSQGVYTYDIPCDSPGDWLVEWHGETTTLQKTIATSFRVEE